MPLLLILFLLLLFIFCFRISVSFRWTQHPQRRRPRTPSALERGGYAYKDRSAKDGGARTLQGVVGEVMGRREGLRGDEVMLRGGSDGSESPGRVGGLGVWRVES